MLWRTPYETPAAEAVGLPTLAGDFLSGESWILLDDFVLVGAFDLRGLSEVGIWLRLLDDAGVGAVVAFFESEWVAADRSALEVSVPYSQHGHTLMATDPKGEWLDLISPDKPERAFAAVVKGHAATVLMAGPPTEEAWDEFRAAMSK